MIMCAEYMYVEDSHKDCRPYGWTYLVDSFLLKTGNCCLCDLNHNHDILYDNKNIVDDINISAFFIWSILMTLLFSFIRPIALFHTTHCPMMRMQCRYTPTKDS